MAEQVDDRPAQERHRALLAAVDALKPEFELTDEDTNPAGRAASMVSSVRRRRASLVDERESEYRELALVERDGVLLWRSTDERAPTRPGERRRRRRERAPLPPGTQELTRIRTPVLGPNQYLKKLEDLDRRLNGEHEQGLRRVVVVDGRFVPGPQVRGPFKGRTLLIVHGTFSSAKSLVGDVGGTDPGRALLADAIVHKAYDQVLCFDHATLSVSPLLNAMDLARQVATTSGQVDVIAHSRGGLVVQWWLEVLSAQLEAGGASVRVFLAGSPLRGTSLAAPDKIHDLVNLVTNIGSAVATAAKVAAATNPFATAALGLTGILGNALADAMALPPVDDLGKRGSLDAAMAVIPGLHGQSAVDNNAELSRLRSSASALDPLYHAVTANFETEDIGWKFWKFFRKDKLADAVTSAIFPEANDLVVDTAFMTTLGTRLSGEERVIPVERLRLFDDPKRLVWHCSYFEQPETIDDIRKAFRRP